MKTFEVSARILIFATLTVEAESEAIARARAAARIKAGEFTTEDHTAALDTIESVTAIED